MRGAVRRRESVSVARPAYNAAGELTGYQSAHATYLCYPGQVEEETSEELQGAVCAFSRECLLPAGADVTPRDGVTIGGEVWQCRSVRKGAICTLVRLEREK